MSTPPLRLQSKMCGRKQQYITESTAHKALRMLLKSYPEQLGRLQVYRCPFCTYYHFGHVR